MEAEGFPVGMPGSPGRRDPKISDFEAAITPAPQRHRAEAW